MKLPYEKEKNARNKVEDSLKWTAYQRIMEWDQENIIGVPKGQEGKCNKETIIKEIIHMKFQELSIIDIKIQEAQRISVKADTIRNSPRHIVLRIIQYR